MFNSKGLYVKPATVNQLYSLLFLKWNSTGISTTQPYFATVFSVVFLLV